MIPIHELLSRIRWDKEFGQGSFEIGYYDRLLDKIIRVAFSRIIFDQEDRRVIQLKDFSGELYSVPLHRIYEVYKDKELIWHRDLHQGDK